MIEHLYGSGYDNILVGSAVSGTAPSATYLLSTILSQNPADRIRWGGTSASITFTLGSSKTGGVLVIPVTNATAITLSNGGGLSCSVTIPTPYRSGHPRTIAFDFHLLGTLAASTWTVAFTSAANLIVGGAIGIFPRLVLPGLRFEFSYGKKYAVSDEPNEYLTRYRFNYKTNERTLNGLVWTPGSALSTLEDLFDGGHGSADPGFLSPLLDGIDPCFGTWADTFSATRVGDSDRFAVPLVMRELSKGKPVF